MTKKIGITGGIGTGKTSACKLFEELGVPVFYADFEAKWLMSNKEEIKNKIIELFGRKSFIEQQLNRPFIANKIFKDSSLKTKLERVVHPAVAQHFEEWVKKHSEKAYVLKEAALIYETGGEKKLDAVIVVHTEEEIRIQRVIYRDSSDADQVKARIQNQMDQMLKVNKADFLIENNTSPEDLELSVDQTHKDILKWISSINE